MTAFTAQQSAELRDSFARSRIAAAEESRRLMRARYEERRLAVAEAPTKKQFPKKAKQRKRVPEFAVVAARPVEHSAPSNTRMVVTLTRDDLSPSEQFVFDRVYAACNTEFSLIDVVTHAALVARAVVAARKATQRV